MIFSSSRWNAAQEALKVSKMIFEKQIRGFSFWGTWCVLARCRVAKTVVIGCAILDQTLTNDIRMIGQNAVLTS